MKDGQVRGSLGSFAGVNYSLQYHRPGLAPRRLVCCGPRSAVCGLVPLLVPWILAAGCASTPLDAASNAYSSGDYGRAYALAQARVAGSPALQRQEAHYIAGMAAHQLNDGADAVRHLRAATQSDSNEVAGRAAAQLGLIYDGQGRFDRAIVQFRKACPLLRGEDQARAYLQMAVTQQKLGQWSAAAANLEQARRTARRRSTMDRIASHVRYRGFAVQIGAFAIESNARRSAAMVAGRTRSMQLGPPRLVRATGNDGRQLFLVQIGDFRDFQRAALIRRRFGPDAVVVPRQLKTVDG